MGAVSYDFTGQTAIVTGAGKGIGRAIARAFAQAGANVVLAGRHPETLATVADECAAVGGKTLIIPADVQLVAQVRELIARTISEFGKIDVLVNNSGVNRTAPSLEIDEATWDWIIDTNVKGMFFACQAVGKHMIERGRGKIINIGSIISHIGLGFNVPYACSKGAVALMTKSLALEWGRHGINVNAVGPGYVLTDQVRWLFETPGYRDGIMAKQPMGALPTEEDIAAAVLFLGSEAARFINGEVVYVDGASAAGWAGPE
jgi:NAD(P)-dependent dehydrogenase (short-subunit alcohol dehydrogenase family)